jgi:hypothetical protein
MKVKRLHPFYDYRIQGDRLDIWNAGVVKSFTFPEAKSFLDFYFDQFENGRLVPSNQEYEGEFSKFLEGQGLLYEIEDSYVNSNIEDLYIEANRQVDAEVIAERLRQAQVTILGDPTLGRSLEQALQGCGLNTCNLDSSDPVMDDKFDMTVYIADSVADGRLQNFNRQMIEGNETRPWLPIFRQVGDSVLFGPIIYPSKTACIECLRLRMTSTIPTINEEYLNPGTCVFGNRQDFKKQPTSTEKLTIAAVSSVVLNRICLREYSSLSRPGFINEIRKGNFGLEIHHHRVLKAPRCGVCGESSQLGYPQVWHHGG